MPNTLPASSTDSDQANQGIPEDCSRVRFVLGLAGSTEGDGGLRFQAFERNFPSAGSADTVGSVLNFRQGKTDLVNQPHLALGKFFQKFKSGIITLFFGAIVAFPTEAFLFFLIVDFISDPIPFRNEPRFEFLEFFGSHG